MDGGACVDNFSQTAWWPKTAFHSSASQSRSTHWKNHYDWVRLAALMNLMILTFIVIFYPVYFTPMQWGMG